MLRRWYRRGRLTAHMSPICRSKLLKKAPICWWLIRMGSIFKMIFWLAISLIPLALHKPQRMLNATRWLGYNIESMRMAKNREVKFNIDDNTT